MTRSLVRWIAAVTVAVGFLYPASSPAQIKLNISDQPLTTTASLVDQAEDGVQPPQPMPSTESSSDLPTVASIGDSDFCCDNVCDMCCVPRNWITADYLLWWTKGNNLPAMVTTSPAGTPQTDAGVIGAANTAVLFGNGEIDNEDRSGLRLTFGHWADPDGTVGIQATYFSVFDDTGTGDFFAQTTGVIGAGGGSPILARPFFNVDPANTGEDARLVSFPNVVDGSISITSSSEMHSASVLLRQHWRSGCRGRIDLIGGYRYFRLRDGFLVREGLVLTDPAGLLPIGTTLAIEDRFLAENDFHGGDMGFLAEFWNGCWTLELLAKVALGNLHREATISGQTVIDTPPAGGAVVSNGGLLALPTNSGSQTSNDFAALPEFGINVKYEPRRNVAIQAGYTLLLLNDVSRSGELIDRVVNATQLNGGALVGTARPTSQFDNQTDFWAQGLNVGVTFTR